MALSEIRGYILLIFERIGSYSPHTAVVPCMLWTLPKCALEEFVQTLIEPVPALLFSVRYTIVAILFSFHYAVSRENQGEFLMVIFASLTFPTYRNVKIQVYLIPDLETSFNCKPSPCNGCLGLWEPFTVLSLDRRHIGWN
jgi:hypothetical protein